MAPVLTNTDVKVCRLCQIPCGGTQKCISEENAEMSEVYKITVKYFPAKLLQPYWSSATAALCVECWRHIIEFHSFQESIIEIQKKLLGWQHDVDIDAKYVTTLPGIENNIGVTSVNGDSGDIKPKLEYTPLSELTVKYEVSADENCQNVGNIYTSVNKANDAGYIEIDISLSDLEDIDVQFSSDDEMSVTDSLDTRKEIELKTPLPNPMESSVYPASAICEDKATSSLNATNVEEDIDQFIAKYKPKLDCWICNKSLSTYALFQNHFRRNHSSGQCYSVCCKRKYISRLQLADHIRSKHAHKQGYMCEICKIEYPRASILKKHKFQRHHYKCSECPKYFATSEQLDKHYQAHLVCQECNKEFKTTDGVKSHTRMVHITGKTTATQADSLTNITCKECGKSVDSKSQLENHQRYAHKNDCKYKCNTCEKAFKKFLHFRDHMNYHTKDNYYKCPHCSAKLQYWSLLESHMRCSHTERCTKKHMKQLLLAEEAHVIVLRNGDIKNEPFKTDANIEPIVTTN